MKKILFFVCSVSLAACTGSHFKTEVAQVDSLLKEAEKLEKGMLAVDTIRLDSISMEASNNINHIKRVYDTDTIDMVEARGVTTYKALRKISGRSKSERRKIWKEMALTKKQLTNLKSDLERGIPDEPTAKKYVQEEKLAFVALAGMIDNYHYNIDWAYKQFDSLTPVIQQIILREDQEAAQKK